MAYTTKTKIEKYLAIDIDSSFDTEVTNWIAIVTAWIEAYVGKSFEGASATKHYDGNGRDRILVDSFTGNPTEVSILDTEGNTETTLTITDDYLTYPLNQTEKTEIVLTPNSSRSHFPAGKKRLKVVATFGYSTAVPSDVELVATKLVADIISKGLEGGKIASVRLGDYGANFQEVDNKADALGIFNILDAYRELGI